MSKKKMTAEEGAAQASQVDLPGVPDRALQQRLVQLEAELKSERARARDMELELARVRNSGELKMTNLGQLLLEALAEETGNGRFNNPALEHLNNQDQARCWLHDPNCARAPDLDHFGARMELCSSCDAFKRTTPDSYTRLGELVNAVLFQLDRKHEQYKSAQEQLIQSEKLAGLGELAAGLAHEINTPTGIILARLDVMELDAANMPQTLREDLQVIRRHADRLRRITSSLTSFARRHKIEKRPVMLQELLRELLDITERLVEKGNVTVSSRMPAEAMQVFGDGTLIQQVFMNLIINARDAMPDGGHLDITGWIEGGECVLEFRDSGTGIDEETIKRIFDPFFTTKDTRGTGLGLSVSYGIMKDHGGRIEVESEVGVGTVFRLFLPYYETTMIGATA
jgi:two-component system NtrC family sensor kinase